MKYFNLIFCLAMLFGLRGTGHAESAVAIDSDPGDAPITEEDDSGPSFQITVQQLDEKLGMEDFQKEPVFNVKTLKDLEIADDKLAAPDDLPAPESRDKALWEAQLGDAVKDWDELDRDMLYLRAKNQTLEELKVKYPKLNRDALKRLKERASR